MSFIRQIGFVTVIVLNVAAAVMLFIVAVGSGFFSDKAVISFVADGSRFIQQDEEIRVVVRVDSPTPMNAAAASVRYPTDKVEVVSVSKEHSIFDLWVKEPSYDAFSGIVEFSGGIIRGSGSGGDILKITFKSKTVGEVVIDFADASVLAADGKGTEILGKQRDITFFVREQDRPSPDVNNDNQINFSDLSILLTHFGKPSQTYDLDGDGKVALSDISIVLGRLVK